MSNPDSRSGATTTHRRLAALRKLASSLLLLGGVSLLGCAPACVAPGEWVLVECVDQSNRRIEEPRDVVVGGRTSGQTNSPFEVGLSGPYEFFVEGCAPKQVEVAGTSHARPQRIVLVCS